jgi:hypothetical protein
VGPATQQQRPEVRALHFDGGNTMNAFDVKRADELIKLQCVRVELAITALVAGVAAGRSSSAVMNLLSPLSHEDGKLEGYALVRAALTPGAPVDQHVEALGKRAYAAREVAILYVQSLSRSPTDAHRKMAALDARDKAKQLDLAWPS